jgi:hypothetical protein
MNFDPETDPVPAFQVKDLDQGGFYEQNTADKKNYLVLIENCNLLIPSLLKRRPAAGEAFSRQKRTSSTSKN